MTSVTPSPKHSEESVSLKRHWIGIKIELKIFLKFCFQVPSR